MRFVLPALAILYALCPYDLVPDFLIGPGWLDDATLLGFLGWYLLNRKKRAYQGQRMGDRGNGAETDETWQSRHQHADAGTDSQRTETWDPYRVLGVAPGAPPENIKRAYRELANKYHPDKVSHLGEEFRDLAEHRFKKIQQAYNELASSGN